MLPAATSAQWLAQCLPCRPASWAGKGGGGGLQQQLRWPRGGVVSAPGQRHTPPTPHRPPPPPSPLQEKEQKSKEAEAKAKADARAAALL
jgi:hypothetical protein